MNCLRNLLHVLGVVIPNGEQVHTMFDEYGAVGAQSMGQGLVKEHHSKAW